MYIHVHVVDIYTKSYVYTCTQNAAKVNTLLLDEIKMMSVVCYMILDYGTVRYYSLVMHVNTGTYDKYQITRTHFLSLMHYTCSLFLRLSCVHLYVLLASNN